MLNVAKEVSALERMTVDQLRKRYLEVFREPTFSRHKQYLIKRIAWRLQANVEGGLSERARLRAMELADIADLRVTAPRKRTSSPGAEERTTTIATSVRPNGKLLPGMAIQREYKGHTVRVTALDNGFDYEGERFRSLTAVAKAVTGKHWNGFHFFGLRGKGAPR